VWLAIEGIVGAGKTTTAKLIGERPETEPVIERLEDHPFLEAYYRDPRRYSVETEIMFMLLQVHQLRDVDPAGDIVSDFSPAKNLVFARTNSPGDSQRLLADLHSRLWLGLPRPDVAVFLDVSATVCLDRVVKRGRSYEQGIEVGELTALRSAYLDSLAILADRVETLTLDGTETPEAVAAAATRLAET
jgi:deoxyguanosine kinase